MRCECWHNTDCVCLKVEIPLCLFSFAVFFGRGTGWCRITHQVYLLVNVSFPDTRNTFEILFREQQTTQILLSDFAIELKTSPNTTILLSHLLKQCKIQEIINSKNKNPTVSELSVSLVGWERQTMATKYYPHTNIHTDIPLHSKYIN